VRYFTVLVIILYVVRYLSTQIWLVTVDIRVGKRNYPILHNIHHFKLDKVNKLDIIMFHHVALSIHEMSLFNQTCYYCLSKQLYANNIRYAYTIVG